MNVIMFCGGLKVLYSLSNMGGGKSISANEAQNLMTLLLLVCVV